MKKAQHAIMRAKRGANLAAGSPQGRRLDARALDALQPSVSSPTPAASHDWLHALSLLCELTDQELAGDDRPGARAIRHERRGYHANGKCFFDQCDLTFLDRDAHSAIERNKDALSRRQLERLSRFGRGQPAEWAGSILNRDE